VLCRVFEKTKGDGDGQDNRAGGASSPTLTTVSSHVIPEQEHHAPCGYYDPGFVPQQEVSMLPYYYGGPAVDRHGFPQDAALPGLEFGARGVAGGEHGFGYFDMASFDDTANHALGGMGFPQGWN
jgi:hypothetical protein